MSPVVHISLLLLTGVVLAVASSVQVTHSFDGALARRPECMRPPRTGRCRALHDRFAWNATSQQCEHFIFGGCQSNGNEFRKKDVCERVCRPVEPCAEGFFECSDRRCIPHSFVCNGQNDCPNSEDEHDCTVTHSEHETNQDAITTTSPPVMTTTPMQEVEWRLRKWGSCYPRPEASCGPASGERKRRRVCYIVGTNQKAAKWSQCSGQRFLTLPCEFTKCPVHGGMSNWTDWSECSATCGKSRQVRRRQCDNPTPKYGGRPCRQAFIEKRRCKVPACAVQSKAKMCRRMPCRNGGTCVSHRRGFTCMCPITHFGPICQFGRATQESPTVSHVNKKKRLSQ